MGIGESGGGYVQINYMHIIFVYRIEYSKVIQLVGQ